MRIAQIAPLWETIPPRTYGGTELVIHLLTEQLTRLGHQVTLFAAGTSETAAKLDSCTEIPLRDLPDFYHEGHLPESAAQVYPGHDIALYYELRMLEKIFARADEFDVIHNHLNFSAMPFARMTKTPMVTTLHGPLTAASMREYVERDYLGFYADLPYVSISDSQRRPCPSLNYVRTIYHGLDTRKYQPSYTFQDKNYLAFLGRMCPEKGVHLAIQAAKATGKNLILAGKLDGPEERAFFKAEIEPHLDNEQIIFIGEVNHAQKVELLRNAIATLCPITWAEPFGLVLIESMACGTPVIAMNAGSVPEIIRNGVNGFVVENVDEMIEAIRQIGRIDRRVCHADVCDRFSVEAMACHYVEVYQQLAKPAAFQERHHFSPMISSEHSMASAIHP